jgi:DNA repair protein RecO (recombination protein O)
VDQYFSPQAGGVLCPECGSRSQDARRVSLSALKVMRHLQRHPFATAMAPRVRPEVLADVDQILEGYMSYLLEKKLQVPAFLRTLRHLEGAAAGGVDAA